MKIFPSFAVLLLASLLMGGCTGTPELKTTRQSGFLSDYSMLEAHKTDSGAQAWRWISPAMARRSFSQLQVDPLIFYPAPVTTDLVSMEALNDLARQLTATVRQSASAQQIPIADQPDSRTLTLRAALTTVELKDKKFQLRELVPIHLIWSAAELAMGKRDKNVTVILEYEFVDASSGETLARGVRQDAGIPVVNNQTPLTIANAKPVLQDLVKDLNGEFGRLKQVVVARP